MAVIREGLGGLEYFRKMIAGELAPPPMLALLGIRLVEADEGRVVFTGTVEPQHYNGMGVAHGGYAAVDLECGQRFDGPFHGGKAAFAFLRHRQPHQPFVYASR